MNLYEAATGRYLQSDPIGLAGGESTYGYGAEEPLVSSDRLGLACPPGLKVAGRCFDSGNYIRDGVAGVLEMVVGQYQYRLLQGRLDNTQRHLLQQELNKYQHP